MPTNLTIETLIGDVVGSTGHRYGLTDSAGNTMDTVKIITNPAGGYLGVYHTGNTVNLASSTDLLNWVFRRTLDAQATQPTICALPTGGYLTAVEYNDQARSGGLLRLRHYANLSALLAGAVDRERTIPRSLSGCNEGTPNFYSVSLTPDIDHSIIDVGFHYQRNCDLDRQARGRLTNFTSWTAAADHRRGQPAHRSGRESRDGSSKGTSEVATPRCSTTSATPCTRCSTSRATSVVGGCTCTTGRPARPHICLWPPTAGVPRSRTPPSQPSPPRRAGRRSSPPCSSRPRAPRRARPASWCTTARPTASPVRGRRWVDQHRRPDALGLADHDRRAPGTGVHPCATPDSTGSGRPHEDDCVTHTGAVAAQEVRCGEIELIGVVQRLRAAGESGAGLVGAPGSGPGRRLPRQAVIDGGDLDLPSPVPERGIASGLINEAALVAMTEGLNARVSSAVGRGTFPMVYGGDCSTLLGTVTGAA